MYKPKNKMLKYAVLLTLAVALVVLSVYYIPAVKGATSNFGSTTFTGTEYYATTSVDRYIHITSVYIEVTAAPGFPASYNYDLYFDGVFIETIYDNPSFSDTYSADIYSAADEVHTVTASNLGNIGSLSISGYITYTLYYLVTVDSAYGNPTIMTSSINGGAPTAFSTAWVPSGDSYTVNVTDPFPVGSGARELCTSSTSQTYTATEDKTVTFNWQLQYEVTYGATGLDSSAQGTVVTVDSSAITYASLPYSKWVNNSASTSFTYASTVDSSTTGKQFRLSSSVSSPQTISAPTTITSGYTIQYYLTVTSAYSTPYGAGWYDAGSTVSCTVTSSPVSGGTGIQHVFVSWTGTGTGSYTGTSIYPTSIVMSGPITETANWNTQYYLTVDGIYATSYGSGWYNAGATASFNVTSPISGGAGSQLAFSSWTGTGSGSYSGSTNNTSCTMNAPITETAHWTTQYYVTVSSSHGTTTGSGWYDSGSTAYAGLTSGTVSGGSGVRYSFVSWSTGGTNYTQSNPITVTYPITVSASWSTQYYLTVSSAHGLPTGGANWYNSGSSATASVSSSIDGDYTFAGWTGDASGGSITSSAITMNAPKTATATWTYTGGGGGGSVDYNVTINGPYYENGNYASDRVDFSLSFVNGSIYQSFLNGTIHSVYISSTSAFEQVTWNASSTSGTLNATRIYRFANGANGINDTVVNLFILDATKPAYQYTFSISDYYGMTTPYLQTAVSTNGSNSFVVERVNLDETGGYVTFVMQQYQIYTLSFICGQGTYSQLFTANVLGTPGQLSINLNVLAGNFPAANATNIITAFTNRTDSNTIAITYLDPSGETTWVYIIISHDFGGDTVIDYTSPNATGDSQVFSWGLAEASLSYDVTVVAYSGNQTYTFNLSLPAYTTGSNPWDIDWSYIGQYIPTLPTSYTGWNGIDPTQILAALIILFALGIGSYFSTGASCILSWVIAGLLLAMGWWQGSIPLFILAGFISVLILIDEYKKTGGFNL